LNFVQAKEEEEEDEGKVQVDQSVVITSEADAILKLIIIL